MGCMKSKLVCLRKSKTKKQWSPEAFHANRQDLKSAVRLSEQEVLKQLQDEGIVPSRQASGGVAFSVPVDVDAPCRKPPRRLEQLSVKPHYTKEERHMIAEISRFDRMVEQVQRKAIDRECKRRIIHQEKARQNAMKKLQAQSFIANKEEQFKKFARERDATRKLAAEKNAAKRRAVLAAKKSFD